MAVYTHFGGMDDLVWAMVRELSAASPPLVERAPFRQNSRALHIKQPHPSWGAPNSSLSEILGGLGWPGLGCG
jgi:hypothetical protein